MLWFALAIGGAAFDALYYILFKKFLRDIDQSVLFGGVSLISAVILFSMSLAKGAPPIGANFYSAVLITGIINTLAAFLYLHALKISDVSLTIPFLSFAPAFLVVTSFIFLKEVPTLWRVAGVFLIVFGSFLMSISKKMNWKNTGYSIFADKGTRYMLMVAFLFSISINFDKLAVINSDVFFSSAAVNLFLGVVFSIIALMTRKKLISNASTFFSFIILAGVTCVGSVLINSAYQLQTVTYVIAIKRLSILLSVLYGGLVLREPFMKRRFVAATLMVAGVVFILVL